MNLIQKTSIAIALAATFGATAQAAVVNGNFDSGLNGWNTLGDASVQSGQLLLTNTTVAADDVDGTGNPIASLNRSGQDAVEANLLTAATALAAGALDPSPFDFAAEGAIAWQSFSGNAGDTFSFIWNFGTRDSFADYAFFVLDGVLVQLASSADATLAGSGDNLFETGYNPFTLTLQTGGTHRIAFGVVDVNDTAVMSSLRIDQVQLSAANQIPEPGSLALLGLGVGLLAWQRRRAA
jgi:hypothetical protein